MIRRARVRLAKNVLGRRLQFHDDFGCCHRQSLARSDIERHAGPAPGVDLDREGGERLDVRARRHAVLVAVAPELTAHHPSGVSGRIDRKTLTCSLWRASSSPPAGGSMARKPTTCSM